MPLDLSTAPSSDFIEYNSRLKKLSGLFMISVIILIAFSIVLYITFLRKLAFFQGTHISLALSHIKSEIMSGSPMGFMYITFFGGLFFLFTPIEAFFIASINTGRFSPAHALFMSIGLLSSYSLNYMIGLRFSRFSKKLVSPKKFYKTKVIVNKFGKLAILFFNMIGVGSQQLTFVLGVFRYNKTRVFIFSVIGQLIKYIAIAVTMIWIIR